MHVPSWRDVRILVIDDEEMNIEMLRRVLEPEGYSRFITTTDPRRALDLYREHHPDLILLDLKMPHLEGHEVLALFREEIPPDTYLPILVLTSDGSSEAKRRALSGGARDFLTKPLSPIEVRLRIRNLLETRFLHLAMQNQNQWLEERVRERTAELTRRTVELEEARIEILQRLARAAEFRDDETGLHTQRVGRTAALLAEGLGIAPSEVEVIRRAAPLHDIGKIGIPDAVLLKGGRLSLDEFEVMKTHTLIGADILSGSSVPLLATGREIALTHHEHWDGSGYPAGLAGEAIPLPGRAVAVADVFDALTHPRPYKPAWTPDAALDEIQRQAGRQFDPEIARAFAALHREGRMATPIAV
jgi:putative two-component system response regulator